MSEEKKGHAKFTIEVEMNKEFMDVMKEAMANMSKMRMKTPSMKEEAEKE